MEILLLRKIPSNPIGVGIFPFVVRASLFIEDVIAQIGHMLEIFISI